MRELVQKKLQSPEAGSKATVPAKPSRNPNHVTFYADMVEMCADAQSVISCDPQLGRLFVEFSKMWSIMHLHPVDGHDRLNALYDEIDHLICNIINDALRRQNKKYIYFKAHVVPPHSNEPAHITLTLYPTFFFGLLCRNDRQVRKHMEIPV